MVSSNFHLHVESMGRVHFEAVMKMAFDDHAKATHYAVSNDGLILYWHESPGALALPYEMGVAAATEFVWGWLQTADRGDEPDHDGSNSKDGFIFKNRGPKGWSYEFVHVKAVWSEFHK